MVKDIIIAITGASGSIYGIRMLEILKEIDYITTHLIISNAGKITLKYETERDIKDIIALATYNYSNKDIGASIACGSFTSFAMVIAPCSVNTMSHIAHGITDNLISRAADVSLKERRKLLLMLRETPLHIGHIKSMGLVTDMGAIVAPLIPAFHNKPKTIDDIVDYSVLRSLSLLDIEGLEVPRWQGIK